jgi:hypothetical protein
MCDCVCASIRMRVYLTCKNQGEKYNDRMESLHLERYAPRNANALVLRQAFRTSHTARITVLDQLLSLHCPDPSLMNEYIEVRAKCAGVAVGLNHPFADHVTLLPAPKELHFSGCFFPNEDSVQGVAVKLLNSIVEGEPIPEVVKPKLMRKLLLPETAASCIEMDMEYRPFKTDAEWKLLRAILTCDGVIVSDKAWGSDGSLEPLWAALLKGDTNKIINVHQAALQYALFLCGARSNQEVSITCCGVVVRTAEVCFPVSVCMCMYVSLGVCVCLCMSVYVCVCLCLPLSVCLSVSVCVCLCLSVSVCVCLCRSVSVCICLCLSVSVCVSLCMSVFVSIFLSLSVYACVCLRMSISCCVCMCLHASVIACLSMHVSVSFLSVFYVSVCVC